MSWSRRISRRRFLVVAAATVPAAAAALEPWRAIVAVRRDHSLAARLARLVAHRDSARVIGGEYLQMLGGGVDRLQLVAALASELPGGHRAAGAASAEELAELVAGRVRQDFEDERTISLRGWIVSVTEARLAAIAGTTPQRPAA